MTNPKDTNNPDSVASEQNTTESNCQSKSAPNVCFNKPLVGKKTDVQNPELWQFPMDYPMSIIGHEGMHQELLDELKLILGSQFPEFDLASIQVVPSKTGRFHSARVNLYLTSVEEVNELYAALDNAKSVRMVV